MPLIAAALFAAAFGARLADSHAADPILMLSVVPVMICALERGVTGGIVGTMIDLALTIVWDAQSEVHVSALGYGTHVAAFAVVGVVVGRFAAARDARERRLTRTYDVAVDLQCIADLDGYFRSVARSWTQVLGYSKAELTSRPFIDFVHPDDRQKTLREAERLATGDTVTVRFENRYQARDGSYRWLSWTARGVPDERLIYASARDVTDQHDNREALERLVAEQRRELEIARVEALRRLAIAAEYRDDDTHEHTERVGALAAMLGERLALDRELVAQLRLAAPLHDIGKLGVPDSILLKPGGLTARERETMQTHTTMGAAILSESDAPVLQLAERIALSHHERWDGTGYPNRLDGQRIPIGARIVAVADVFDALTHARPYKPAWDLQDAMDAVTAAAGSQFDPHVVSALAALHEEARLEPFVPAQERPAGAQAAAPVAH